MNASRSIGSNSCSALADRLGFWKNDPWPVASSRRSSSMWRFSLTSSLSVSDAVLGSSRRPSPGRSAFAIISMRPTLSRK